MKIKSLDPIMRDIARGTSAALLTLLAMPFAMAAFCFLLECFTSVAFGVHPKPSFLALTSLIDELHRRPSMGADLAFAIFWFAAVRCLPNLVARVVLGIMSAVILFVLLVGIVPLLLHPRLEVLAFIIPLSLIGILGFTATLWTSIRPEQPIPPGRYTVRFA